MTKLSGNKGEWSEIYVFLRLLEVGKLYAATENLEKIDTVFYNVLKIIRNEDIGTLEFIFNKETNTISILNTSSGIILLSLDTIDFKNEADKLYKAIVSSKGSSFSVDKTEIFLKNIGINKLKAKSSDKSDIRIKIHDINSGFEAIQGFSIKSRLGNPSTLINAGKTTNFIYEIIGNINDNIANKFNNDLNTFKNRFEFLYHNNCCLIYNDMANITFKNNLILIDGVLPEITAHLLIAYYKDGYSNVVSAIEKITQDNPLGYNLDQGHPFYSYKFKKFLTECALGMLPSKMWNGIVDATGGYIIVKEDGEVLCYHLFNRNEFENYLLKSTRFETASTSRHEFGKIYKENNKYYIKLNLQIRFIK